jgi:hypothetical protein
MSMRAPDARPHIETFVTLGVAPPSVILTGLTRRTRCEQQVLGQDWIICERARTIILDSNIPRISRHP